MESRTHYARERPGVQGDRPAAQRVRRNVIPNPPLPRGRWRGRGDLAARARFVLKSPPPSAEAVAPEKLRATATPCSLSPASCAGERVGVRGPTGRETREPNQAVAGTRVSARLRSRLHREEASPLRLSACEYPQRLGPVLHATPHPGPLPRRTTRGRGDLSERARFFLKSPLPTSAGPMLGMTCSSTG